MMTPLRKMSKPDLIAVAIRMEVRAEGTPADLERMTRGQLVAYIEALRPPERARLKKARLPAGRMPKNLGVGRWCRQQLSKIIGQTPDGHPVGLSYAKIVAAANRKFPMSAFDERHARWYAAQMRRDGLMIPVERERSRWI